MNRVNAFRHFAEFDGPTQSQQHIKPLHDYVTSRLVLEGGFHPDQLVPHPPLRVIQTHGENRIVFDPSRATVAEATILGSLKTKNVDIVVVKDGIGPVLAVSCKGMTGAIRNLTNRLEETIGECTNIHISYPALVFGYLFVMRANRLGHGVASTDVAIDDQSRPVGGDRSFPLCVERDDRQSRHPQRFEPLRGGRHGYDRDASTTNRRTDGNISAGR